MAKFVVEDTWTGYRISLMDPRSGAVRHSIDEDGGHGPIEGLYAEADRLWTELRAKEINNNAASQ